MKLCLIALVTVYLLSSGLSVSASESTKANSDKAYVDVKGENVVVDTDGLIQATDQLSESIHQLSTSLDQLASENKTFSEDEKLKLIQAAESVSSASAAIEQMASELPDSIQQFGNKIPQAIAASEKPIEQITASVVTAANGIQTVVESLPTATENARVMALEVIDSVFWSFIKYGVLFVVLVIVVLAISIWLFYSQWIKPLLQEYKALSDAPRQFALMSEHMKLTSENLLLISQLADHKSENMQDSQQTIIETHSDIENNEPDEPTPTNT